MLVRACSLTLTASFLRLTNDHLRAIQGPSMSAVHGYPLTLTNDLKPTHTHQCWFAATVRCCYRAWLVSLSLSLSLSCLLKTKPRSIQLSSMLICCLSALLPQGMASLSCLLKTKPFASSCRQCWFAASGASWLLGAETSSELCVATGVSSVGVLIYMYF